MGLTGGDYEKVEVKDIEYGTLGSLRRRFTGSIEICRSYELRLRPIQVQNCEREGVCGEDRLRSRDLLRLRPIQAILIGRPSGGPTVVTVVQWFRHSARPQIYASADFDFIMIRLTIFGVSSLVTPPLCSSHLSDTLQPLVRNPIQREKSTHTPSIVTPVTTINDAHGLKLIVLAWHNRSRARYPRSEGIGADFPSNAWLGREVVMTRLWNHRVHLLRQHDSMCSRDPIVIQLNVEKGLV